MARSRQKTLLHDLQVHQVELEMQNDELRRTRNELEELLERYTDLYEFAPVGYFALDREGTIRAANLTGAALLGADRGRLPGTRMVQYISGQTGRDFVDCLDRAFAGNGCEKCEVVIERERQPERHARIEALASATREECRVAVVDITDRKQAESDLRHTVDALQHEIEERRRLEQQLLQSRKMEAIGIFAGGVAHDFNNLLTAISGYGEEILEAIPESWDHVRDCAEQVLKSSESAADLTRSLLAFSRKQEIHPKPVMIDTVVLLTGKLIQRVIGEDVEFCIAPSGLDLLIMADPGQLELMLMNLATNSRDAMPGGGRLSVSVRRVTVAQGDEAGYGVTAPGDYALLSVSDTGSGIDGETVKRIFDPFYTTKEVGKGTGLGLSIVYGIVKQHNGSIQVSSEPEKGTTVTIYFPVIESSATGKKAANPSPPHGGTETVLVVEDEEIVKNYLRKVLERAGYAVLTAGNGEEAMALFRERDDIALVLSDVIMPGKNGRELIDEIGSIRPGTGVIFVSGYTADIIRNKGLITKNVELITKPFAKNDLLLKVREVLDRV